MRLRRRKLAVLTDLSRPRLGEGAEEYAAAQSRPSTGLVTVLGAIGLSPDHSRNRARSVATPGRTTTKEL